MATIDEQFIDYIVKQLVSNPEAVKIDRTVDEKGVLLSLTVSSEDIGRVIGKRGATAQSLRNLLRALGSKNNARYNLKIVDIDQPDNEKVPKADSEKVSNNDDENTVKQKEITQETKEIVEDVEETTPEDGENSSELAKKTRKELADFDDLDI